MINKFKFFQADTIPKFGFNKQKHTSKCFQINSLTQKVHNSISFWQNENISLKPNIFDDDSLNLYELFQNTDYQPISDNTFYTNDQDFGLNDLFDEKHCFSESNIFSFYLQNLLVYLPSISFFTSIVVLAAFMPEVFLLLLSTILQALFFTYKIQQRKYKPNKTLPKHFKLKKIRNRSYRGRKVKFKINKVIQTKISNFDILQFPIYLNSNLVHFELDTGSGFNILSLHYVKKFYPNYKEYKTIKAITLYDVNNNPIEVDSVRYLPIYIPTYGYINLPFYIVNTKNTKLLGRNFITRTKLSLIYSNNYINFVFNDKKIPHLLNKDSFHIYPNQTKNVKFKCLNMKHPFVIIKGLKRNNLKINTTLLKNKRNYLLSIKNTSNKDVIVAKNHLRIGVVGVDPNLKQNIIYKRFKRGSLKSRDPFKLPSILRKINQIKDPSHNKKLFEQKNPGFSCEKQTLEQFHDHFSLEKEGMCFDSVLEEVKLTKQEILEKLSIQDSSAKEKIAETLFQLNLISKHTYDVGKIKSPMKVRIKKGCVLPQNCKPYNLNFYQTQQMKAFFDYLILNNLAEYADESCQFGAPCFLVNRANLQKSPRLVIDLRQINEVTEGSKSACTPDPFYTLNELLPHVRYCTSIDLRQAFWSIPVDQETLDSGIQNVLTSWCVYRLKRSLTGLSKTPAKLISYINENIHFNERGELDPIQPLLNLFDDLNLFSYSNETLDEHVQKVQIFLQRLQNLGFKIAIEKSKFCVDLYKENITILGFTIGKGVIKIPDSKVNHILKLSEPNSLKELQSFIGNLTYFRNLLSLPIHNSINALYKYVPNFQWDKEGSLHFKNIISHMHKKSLEIDCTRKYDFNILFTDGSLKAMAGVLFGFNLKPFISNEPLNFGELQDPFFRQYCLQKGIKAKEISYQSNILTLLFEISVKLNLNIQSQCETDFFFELVNTGQLLVSFAYFLPRNDDIQVNQNFRNFISSLMNKKCDITDPFIQSFLILSFSHLTSRNVIYWFKHKKAVSICRGSRAVFFDKSEIILAINHKMTCICLDEKFENFSKTTPEMNLSDRTIINHFYSALKTGDPNLLKTNLRILGYFSKPIDPSILANSAICYIELLAIYLSLEHFETSLLGKTTFVLTDNKVAVACLKNRKQINKQSKLDRLSQRINFWFSNNIKFMTCPGTSQLSDFISRLVPDNKIEDVFLEKNPTPTETNDLFSIFPLKTHIRNIKNYQKIFQTSFQPETVALEKNSNILDKSTFIALQIKENLSTDMNPSTLKYYKGKIILPKVLYSIFTALIHSSLLHPGIDRLYNRINKMYYVEKKTELKKIIKGLCTNCLVCIQHKSTNYKFNKGTATHKYITSPNIIVAGDLIEFSIIANKQKGIQNIKGLFLLCDVFSKYVTIFPLQEKNQITILHSLTMYCGFMAVPKKFWFDNATILNSKKVYDFVYSIGSQVLHSSPKRSSTRGFIENRCRVVQDMIRKYLNQEKFDILQVLATVTYGLNTTPFKGSILSPHNLQFLSLHNIKNDIITPTGFLFQPQITHSNISLDNRFLNIKQDVEILVQETRAAMIKEQEKLTEKRNLNTHPHSFKYNDLVFVKIINRPTYFAKLKPLYSLDLYRVVKVRQFLLTVENLVTNQVINRSIFDVKKLRIDTMGFFQLPPDIVDSLKYISLDTLSTFKIPETDISKFRQKTKVSDKIELNIDENEPEVLDSSSEGEDFLQTIFE